ncbi:MAG: hypothetical protein WC831_01265 [Parcubacteria group bacterium]|jgi:hypothetical protein
MRKFILVFLFILLFSGVAVLSFGFYNAGKIRDFSDSASVLNNKYDGLLQLKEAQKDYQKNASKDPGELRKKSEEFVSRLDEMAESAESARKEVGGLGFSLSGRGTKSEMLAYYEKVENQIRETANINRFSNQIFDVSEIFGKIGADVSLDEMKSYISEAKNENAKVKTDDLPENIKASGQALKDAMDNFLAEMENFASGASDNFDQLNASYNEFSAKENDFFSRSRDYINSLEDLSLLKGKINMEIAGLKGIYFKIK